MTQGMDVEEQDDGVARTADVPGGVLVAHDGSDCAREALQWAAGLAVRAGYPLHVLRAWKITTAPQPATWEPGYVPPLEDFEKAVRDELEASVAAAELDPALSVTCHVAHGAAARRIIESAARADLLVVGARGLGGFAGLVLGSVSDQLVRHAPCPVTVVRTGTTLHDAGD
ncbi:universal stress protein [Geodermatophilus sp. DSM 45219]|uniref:universal stress protein n=1 Tax=Geodermatophilus sp. DSM 45219 TaxID=1881103 RepID=UPI000888B5EB|nr:universal stress protein [Geodermatophilus sp. DSM 45219]SDN71053.1 Nucleotide-binding universal stress protein, UspA family [Geodermatophilus sp. DSM 45219]